MPTAAPGGRPPGTALPAVPAAALPPGIARAGRIASYRAADGRTLRYQVVAARRPAHHLLYLHGIESHGGWFLPAAERLRAAGCTTWLLDRRGSGLNRDAGPGDTPSASALLADVHALRDHLGDPPLHLVGLSWGGKLATAAAIDRPTGVRSLILITPGLRARVDLRLRDKLAVAFALLRGGRKRFTLPIADEMFTRTPAFLDFVRRDPWRLRAVTARTLRASRVLDGIVRRGVADLALPVLLFLAEHDEIVDGPAVLRLLASLRDGRLRVRRYAGATHAIELDQVDAMVADMVRFLADTAPPC